MIRSILRSFLFLLFSTVAIAQTTSVTATVEDSDSTVWANATWNLSFQVGVNQSNPANYTIGGSPLSSTVAYQSGAANGSGVITFTNYQSTAVQPAGSSWNLVVCPNASVACTRVNFATSNSSVDISSIVNAAITAPRFLAVSGAFGYNDGEAILSLKPGSTYWNTTSSTQECYTGSAWGACSSGGGGGGIGGTTTSPNVPYSTSADTLADSGFQYYLGGFDPQGDCLSDSQPCLVAAENGEGTISIGPNQISIVNRLDDEDQMILNDYRVVFQQLSNTSVSCYMTSTLAGCTDATGDFTSLNPNQLTSESGTTTAYAVMDTTGLTIGGSIDGQAAIGVAAHAGTPNGILLPISTGAANAFLVTDGGNPQQTSWTAPGVTVSGSACTITAITNGLVTAATCTP